jgi:CrcB protein
MNHVLQGYCLVFLGGGIGTMLRHGVNRTGMVLLGPDFPAWTMFINITGCLAMGLVTGWFMLRGLPGGPMTRLFLTTGILGGYTTFSAFSLDFAVLWERGAIAAAAIYVLGSVLLSLVAVFAGLFIMRTAIGGP